MLRDIVFVLALGAGLYACAVLGMVL